MISILIPVYNRDVNQLASQLSRQLSNLSGSGEIIFFDDASAERSRRINAAIATLPHIRYLQANVNQGRIRIRQLLAEKAAYDWLLFLDCDSQVLLQTFLEKYCRQLPHDPAVFVGGRIYSQEPPADCAHRLHWKYGSKREAVDPAKRNEDPYPGFMSNNFMVHKNIFNQLSFVSDWQGYGHEDTWIGMQLEKQGVSIIYIDNVVLHDGLERVEVFIPKSEQALRNLIRLQQLVPAATLRRHVKLYRAYSRLKSTGLLWMPRFIYRMMRKRIFDNLESCNPSLFYFDLYRLYQFIQLLRPHK